MNVPTIAKANIYSSYSLPAGNADPTGISDMAAQTETGLQDIVRTDIYTIAGQRVPSLDLLPAGPYIVRYTDSQGNSITRKYIKK